MCFWQAVKITVCWYVQIARARIIKIYITYIKYNILILIESIRVLGFFMSHTNLSRWEDDKHSKVVDHWLLAVYRRHAEFSSASVRGERSDMYIETRGEILN